MTGYAGDLASRKIFNEREEEVRERFSNSFVEMISDLPDTETQIPSEASCSEVCIKLDKGLYKALWDLGEAVGMGLEATHSQIPIKQETIEVCELFGLNPYEVESSGVLYVLPEGELPLEGTLIGKTRSDNDRVVLMKKGTRFLNK